MPIYYVCFITVQQLNRIIWMMTGVLLAILSIYIITAWIECVFFKGTTLQDIITNKKNKLSFKSIMALAILFGCIAIVLSIITAVARCL